MPAQSPLNGLRKAALLVASLDPQTAELLLGRIQPEQAERVRRAVAELGPIDPNQQTQVLEEFRRMGPLGPKSPPGVELETSLARRLIDRAAESASGPEPAEPAEPPFRFLREAELDKLVRVLTPESPQVIALVLAHLPPASAGGVLARLAPPLQVDVIRRLVDLEETEPEILREVERGLQRRFSEQLRMQRRRVAGLAALGAILEASEPRIGMQILDNLAQHDRRLVEKLSPGRFEFADLMALEDEALATAIGAADPELVLLALVGAPPQWLDRLLAHLPEQEAKAVRHRLDHFGPVRLADVDEARRRLVALARRLAIEGRIRLPRKASAPVLS
ncbi:MAG: FliG C-terminal domain-containing protein [Thermoguttaceae bacterium]